MWVFWGGIFFADLLLWGSVFLKFLFGEVFMRMRVWGVVLFLHLVGGDGARGEVAYSRYGYGCNPDVFGCCYSIFGRDYDCEGREVIQPGGRSCYDTGSGSWVIGTCGGGCVSAVYGGVGTTLCVGVNPNIPCTLRCGVFLGALEGSPPGNCVQGGAGLERGFLCDRRTVEMVRGGCRPSGVLSCLRGGDFGAFVK